MSRPLDIGVAVKHATRNDGQGRYGLELIRELARRGHQVTVYAHALDDETAAGVQFHRLSRPPGPMLFDDLRMLRTTSAAMNHAGHDVGWALGPTAAPRRVPFVFNPHFSHAGWKATWPSSTPPAAAQQVHAAVAARVERWVARRCALVVAYTAGLAEECGAPVGVPRVLVPNGVDLDALTPPDETRRTTARRRLGLRAGDFAIGLLGEYHSPRKGLDTALTALAGGPPDEHLVVAGSGPSLDARIAALRLTGRVHTPGFVPAAEVLAALDAVVVPSTYEPFSAVALEATAMGIPAIVSARAGAAGALGDAVISLEPPNTEALRAAIDELRGDGNLRARLRTEGAAKIAGFGWAQVAAMAAEAAERLVASTR